MPETYEDSIDYWVDRARTEAAAGKENFVSICQAEKRIDAAGGFAAAAIDENQFNSTRITGLINGANIWLDAAEKERKAGGFPLDSLGFARSRVEQLEKWTGKQGLAAANMTPERWIAAAGGPFSHGPYPLLMHMPERPLAFAVEMPAPALEPVS